MAEPLRILLIVPRGASVFAATLAAIAEFRGPARLFQVHWNEQITPAKLTELLAWRPDGVLCPAHPDLVATFARRKLPCVFMSWREADVRGLPHGVEIDEPGIGAVAADHLVGCGFTHLATIGWNLGRAEGRHASFIRTLADRGRTCATLELPTGVYIEPCRARVSRWLKQLPKPVGIFTGDDWVSFHLVEIALAAGMAVPDQIAVLGAADEQALCRLAACTLSSVAVPYRELGEAACARLMRRLRGERTSAAPLILKPHGVVSRRSTEVLAVDDAAVAGAMRFIRAHASDPIRVSDVVAASQVGRRSLEHRFRSVLGRTILDEIQRAHVEVAKRLLMHGDHGLVQVALGSGFNDPSRLNQVFRAHLGQSPGEFRRKRQAP